LVEGYGISQSQIRRFVHMRVDRSIVLIDRFYRVWLDQTTSVCDRRVEGGQVNGPHGLCPKDEGIIALTVLVYSCFERQVADLAEAESRSLVDTLEQSHRGKIPRLFERCAKCDQASLSAIIVLRRP